MGVSYIPQKHISTWATTHPGNRTRRGGAVEPEQQARVGDFSCAGLSPRSRTDGSLPAGSRGTGFARSSQHRTYSRNRGIRRFAWVSPCADRRARLPIESKPAPCRSKKSLSSRTKSSRPWSTYLVDARAENRFSGRLRSRDRRRTRIGQGPPADSRAVAHPPSRR